MKARDAVSGLPTQHVEVSLDGEWMETNRTYQHIENQDVYFRGLPQEETILHKSAIDQMVCGLLPALAPAQPVLRSSNCVDPLAVSDYSYLVQPGELSSGHGSAG